MFEAFDTVGMRDAAPLLSSAPLCLFSLLFSCPLPSCFFFALQAHRTSSGVARCLLSLSLLPRAVPLEMFIPHRALNCPLFLSVALCLLAAVSSTLTAHSLSRWLLTLQDCSRSGASRCIS